MNAGRTTCFRQQTDTAQRLGPLVLACIALGCNAPDGYHSREDASVNEPETDSYSFLPEQSHLLPGTSGDSGARSAGDDGSASSGAVSPGTQIGTAEVSTDATVVSPPNTVTSPRSTPPSPNDEAADTNRAADPDAGPTQFEELHCNTDEDCSDEQFCNEQSCWPCEPNRTQCTEWGNLNVCTKDGMQVQECTGTCLAPADGNALCADSCLPSQVRRCPLSYCVGQQICSTTALGTTWSSCEPPFAGEELETAIRDALGVGPDAALNFLGTTRLAISSLYAPQFNGLECFGELRSLSFGSSQIQDLTGFPELPNLTSFELRSTRLRDLHGLPNFPELKTLNLDASNLEDISDFPDVPKLTELYLSQNRLTSLQSLPSLTLLTKLSAFSGQLETAALPDLPALEELTLASNNLSTLEALPDLPSLRILRASLTPLQALGGPVLPSLETLELRATTLPALASLPAHPRLKELDITGSEVNSLVGMPELPLLETLSLGDNLLTQLTGLPDLPALKTLSVRWNQLSTLDDLPSGLQLQLLDAGYNELEDLMGLSGLESVEQLNLDNNQLTRLDTLPDLPGLKRIVLEANPLEEGELESAAQRLGMLVCGETLVREDVCP